jgi:type VI secretion system protein ImpI
VSGLPLLLRIDNVDRLPDGGPVNFELDRRGIDIGRDPYLDWTLPDPERFISGKHCELRYRDGGYWLHDVSTNGTTINGRGGRLTEPYRLQDGDRVHIGNYIISVELKGEGAEPPTPQMSRSHAGGNIWDDVPDAAAAVDRRDFAARARSEPGVPRAPAELPEEDISWSIGELTEGASEGDDPWNAPPASSGTPAGDGWDWTPSPAPDAQGAVAPPERRGVRPEGAAPDQISVSKAPESGPQASPSTAAQPVPLDPFAGSDYPRPGRGTDPVAARSDDHPANGPAPADPLGSGGDPATAGHAAPAHGRPAEPALPRDDARAAPAGLASQWAGGAPAAGASTEAHPPGRGGGFIAAFERGAGLPAGAVANRTDDALAEELGALFRLVTQHLQAMLAARAETKSAMRSADRTMIAALENNPLKFSPTPEEALRIMFGAGTRSYLDARAAIESSFGDLQRHQVQTFGAMQQALQALVDDLDPSTIEAATPEDGGLAGMVGSRRAKLWNTYVERFRAKSGRHERGMVDAFMLLFAEMYDRQR